MTHLSPAQSARLLTVPDAPGSVVATDDADSHVLYGLAAKGLLTGEWLPARGVSRFIRTPFGAEMARRIESKC